MANKDLAETQKAAVQQTAMRETASQEAPAAPEKRARKDGDQCCCTVCGAAVIDSDEQRTLHLSMRHVTEVLGSPGRDTGEFFEYRAAA